MIKGIGTDVVEVGRLEQEAQRHGKDFIARLFTPSEIAYCEGTSRPFSSYAARFAAKESLLKALGTGGRDGISWLELDVGRDSRGRPDLVLAGQALAVARRLGVQSIRVSFSHTDGMATAITVLEGIEEQER